MGVMAGPRGSRRGAIFGARVKPGVTHHLVYDEPVLLSRQPPMSARVFLAAGKPSVVAIQATAPRRAPLSHMSICCVAMYVNRVFLRYQPESFVMLLSELESGVTDSPRVSLVEFAGFAGHNCRPFFRGPIVRRLTAGQVPPGLFTEEFQP